MIILFAVQNIFSVFIHICLQDLTNIKSEFSINICLPENIPIDNFIEKKKLNFPANGKTNCHSHY